MTPKKEKPHYVDNKKFYAEIVKYRESVAIANLEGREAPRMPNYIGECIYKIATKLALKPCFMNYSFKEEMIDDGIENCIMYFKDFDPNKTQNPFAYFTQIIYYAFLRRIAKEERDRYTKYKYFQETIIHSEGVDNLVDSDGDHVVSKEMYANLNDFMERFEAKERERKRKQKELLAKAPPKKGVRKFLGEENERKPEPAAASGIANSQSIEQQGEHSHSEQLSAIA